MTPTTSTLKFDDVTNRQSAHRRIFWRIIAEEVITVPQEKLRRFFRHSSMLYVLNQIVPREIVIIGIVTVSK